MPQDRYNFDKELDERLREQFDIGVEVDISRLNTKWYDDSILNNEKDARITARREARKAKYAKNADVKIISPEEIKEARKKEKRKARKSRLAILFLALAAVIALAVTAAVKLTGLQREKKAAEKELASLEEKVQQLSVELEELDSDEYVENAARSELHMIKNGELMYIVNPEVTEEEQGDDAAK